MVDDRLMYRAIDLAQLWPNTHPNPRVGAVIADVSGKVVGEGWHRGAGTDHAEVVALREAGDAALGATMYVSLEPCASQGRTPPCVDALLEAGISRVIVGTIDPDTRVNGEGIRQLEDAGVEVVTGVAESAARSIDPAYFHHRETGLPLVTVKWAMTLDGSVAAVDGTSQWITGVSAREDGHGQRSRVDGVVVGAGTLRVDDPRLDVRVEGFAGVQPRPVVVAGKTRLPEDAAIWDRDPVVVATHDLEVPSGELVLVSESEGWPDPRESCRRLGEMGMLHLLVEGGPTLTTAWWHAGVVSRGVVYIGSKIGGGAGLSPLAGVFSTMGQAIDVEFEEIRSVGEDVVIVFRRKQ